MRQVLTEFTSFNNQQNNKYIKMVITGRNERTRSSSIHPNRKKKMDSISLHLHRRWVPLYKIHSFTKWALVGSFQIACTSVQPTRFCIQQYLKMWFWTISNFQIYVRTLQYTSNYYFSSDATLVFDLNLNATQMQYERRK